MLSFKEKREQQKIIKEQLSLLSGKLSFSEKRAVQKKMKNALVVLGTVTSNVAEQPTETGNNETETETEIDNSNFGLKTSGIKTRERINEKVRDITSQIKSGKDIATLTTEEIDLLKQYSGKGGLTVNSQHEYYTPTYIAEGVWDALKVNGFENGNVLEPSTGSGVFLATKPSGVVATGVELDETSAMVAKVLNPGDKVENQSFEMLAVEAEDNTFDAVIGNVPFGNARGASAHDDPAYKNEKLIERYFVNRVIDKTKPSGLICLVVPVNIVSARGKVWEKFRIAISKKAEFLGAHKLPSKTFSKQGTSVVVDVIVLRKHSSDFLGKIDDIQLAELQSSNVLWAEFIKGKYWLGEGKRFIKGEFVPKDPNKFRDSDKVIAGKNMTDQALKKALAVKFDSRIDWDALDIVETIVRNYSDSDRKNINGQDYELKDGEWNRLEHKESKTALDPTAFGVSSLEELKARMESEAGILSLDWGNVLSANDTFPNLVPKIVKDSIEFAMLQPDEHQMRVFRGAIIGAKIDSFTGSGEDDANELDELKELILHEVVKYGHPKDIKGLVLSGHESKRLGMFINSVDADGNFSQLLDTGVPSQQVDDFNADDPVSIVNYLYENNQDPIELDTIISMHEGSGRLEDLGDISSVDGLAVSPDGFIYPYSQYCSGDVFPKLRAMRDAMIDEKDQRIIELYKRQIETIDAKRHKTPTEDITFGMRQKWFDNKTYALEYLQTNGYSRTLHYDEELGEFYATGVSGGIVPQIVNYLNDKPVMGGVKVSEYKDQIRALEEQFDSWMKAHSESENLTQTYNEKFNGYVEFEYSSSNLGLNNIGEKMIPHSYQNEAVRRLSREGKGILGLDVGLGKTFTALALQAYNEQMGRSKRTCIVVPDSVLANWYHEHKTFYKNTEKMLIVGMSPKRNKDDLIQREQVLDEKGNPKQGRSGEDIYQDLLKKDSREIIWDKMHKIPQSDLSLVIMTHTQFGKIPVNPTTKKRYASDMMNRELLGQKDANKLIEANPGKVTYAEDQQNSRLEQKYSDEGTEKQDAYPYFEDMGFDSVMTDEAHFFKNSFSPGKESQRIAYLPTPNPSQRAIDMSLKMSHIRELNGGRGPILLTATPITNSPLEIYNMLSLLIPMEEFEEFGVYSPDDFVRVFGDIQHIEKMKVSGDVGNVDAMVGFQNLDGLRSLFHKHSIIKNADDVKLPLPDSEEIQATVELSEGQQDIYLELKTEAKSASSPNKDERESVRPLFSIIRDMDRTTTDLDMYHKRITFIFKAEYKNAVDNALGQIPKTVQRNEYDSDLERDVKITVPLEYNVEMKGDNYVVVMTDAGEEDMIDAIQSAGIPENEVAHPVTPKYAELLKNLRIELDADGKQIVFIEEKTQHKKLARIIVHYLPITLENIGIINATEASGEKLQRISDSYNSGKIKIVLANKKAEVGVNLQKGTTAIHHLTFPWVPASMQQRNGRGVRQGNTSSKVSIYHYVGKGSFDLFRLNLINHKGNWINDILRGSESNMESKGDGHLSAEDVMVLLSDNPEEAKARMEEAKAKREKKKREKAEKAMIINLHQLIEARRKLTLLDDWKVKDHSAIENKIQTLSGKVSAFEDDGSEESKKKLAELKRKLTLQNRKLGELDAKYEQMEHAAQSTIKQKSLFLKAKSNSGELPFNAGAIDNSDNILLTRDGRVIENGKVYEFSKVYEFVTKGYDSKSLEGLYRVIDIDTANQEFTLWRKGSSKDKPSKIGVSDLYRYNMKAVEITMEEWNLAIYLSKPLTLRGLIDFGKDSFEKYRDQIKLENYQYYLTEDSNGGVIPVKSGWNYSPSEDKSFVWPDFNSETQKRSVARFFLNNEPYDSGSMLELFFGSNWKAAIEQYSDMRSQEETLSLSKSLYQNLLNEFNGDEYEYLSGKLNDVSSLTYEISKDIQGDNENDIKKWARSFVEDKLAWRKNEKDRRNIEAKKLSQEASKNHPNYKEVPEEIANRLATHGIVAKYNMDTLYIKQNWPEFGLVLIQDENGKNGLLFAAKEELKSAFGAQFAISMSSEFLGAWWYMDSSHDLDAIVTAILNDKEISISNTNKSAPVKLKVLAGKFSEGDTLNGFVIKSLGKQWEAHDYEISAVKRDSGMDIEEDDLIQYARF